MSFAGFDRDAIALLGALPSYAESQYAAARDVLARGLREPGAALIETAAAAIDPALTVERRASVSPLHHDLRFAQPGAPRYEDHLLLTAWHGRDKNTSASLRIRVGAASVGFASGIPLAGDTRARWRQAVSGPRGESLAGHIAGLAKKYGPDFEVAGDQLKRAPKPWTDAHPRSDLLRRNAFQIRLRRPLPKTVDKPAFATWCAERLRELVPVHAWLVAELGEEAEERDGS